MTHNRTLASARAAIGTALLTLLGACSDAPSSPVSAIPIPTDIVQPTSRVADMPFTDANMPMLPSGARLQRRLSRAPDGTLGRVETLVDSRGHRYVIESSLNNDGLPSEMKVSRDGQPIAQFVNEWATSYTGFTLERQRLVRFSGGQAAETFDTQQRGGVRTLVDGTITVTRLPAEGSAAAVPDFRRAGPLRSLEESLPRSAGPCDAQARAAQSAIEDWLLSVVAVAGATATANPFAAWSAYAYQLKKYGDVSRAEATLDDCVASAGKRPSVETY